jgi:hypothetical protein
MDNTPKPKSFISLKISHKEDSQDKNVEEEDYYKRTPPPKKKKTSARIVEVIHVKL